jgi:hypothetical protein
VSSGSELLPDANFCFCISIAPSIHFLKPPSAQSLRAFSNLSISARIVAISMASTSQKLPSRHEGNLLYVGIVGSSSSHRCQTISVGADGSEFKFAAEKAFSGSHAACTAYHVLRSSKLPTAALQVVEATFRRGFKSYSAHLIFSRACRGINAGSRTPQLNP